MAKLSYNIQDRWNGKVIFTAEIECDASASAAVKLGLAIRAALRSGADLSGADLGSQWVVQGATRSDGYPFFLQMLTGDTEPMVKAGCSLFTVQQAQDHWTNTRGGTPLGDETEIIVRSMLALAKARGLWPVASTAKEAA